MGKVNYFSKWFVNFSKLCCSFAVVFVLFLLLLLLLSLSLLLVVVLELCPGIVREDVGKGARFHHYCSNSGVLSCKLTFGLEQNDR